MEIKTKFDVGQKVWFLSQDETSHTPWCIEGIIKIIDLTRTEANQYVSYKLECYDGSEYFERQVGENRIFATQDELLSNIRHYVMEYVEPESQDEATRD
jgi:hypothetical protein